MQIRRINQIQSNKSFHDFSWKKLCKHRHQDKRFVSSKKLDEAFEGISAQFT